MTDRILVFYGSYRSDRMGIRLADFVVRNLREHGADAELIDAKAVGLPMLDRMLSPEQISDVKESLRDPETGRVPFTGMQDWFSEFMGVFNPNS